MTPSTVSIIPGSMPSQLPTKPYSGAKPRRPSIGSRPSSIRVLSVDGDEEEDAYEAEPPRPLWDSACGAVVVIEVVMGSAVVILFCVKAG